VISCSAGFGMAAPRAVATAERAPALDNRARNEVEESAVAYCAITPVFSRNEAELYES
jgi:hypothetical protein